MGLYSPGRRRAILLLLLTSALLLTVDLRGSSILDGGRSLFSWALRPIESATEVVTRPIENAWRGITDYEDLERRYDLLAAENDEMRVERYIARAYISQNRELRQLVDLSWPGDQEFQLAYRIGDNPTNVDQVIQLDKGSKHNLCVGMPVLAANSLIGRVVRVDTDTAWVRLITDSTFGVSAKVVRPESIDPAQLPAGVVVVETLPPETVPPELDPETGEPIVGDDPSVAGGSLPGDEPAGDELAGDEPTGDDLAGDEPAGDDLAGEPEPLDTTTTTAAPAPPIRSTGLFEGRGPDRSPVVVFHDGLSAADFPQVGDLVFTTGGELSLAPPDVFIGVVTSSTRGSTSEGLVVEVQPQVDLDDLEFVQVMLYLSPQEAGMCNVPLRT